MWYFPTNGIRTGKCNLYISDLACMYIYIYVYVLITFFLFILIEWYFQWICIYESPCVHGGESTFMGERADNVANFLTFFRVVICDLAGMRRRVGGFLSV